MNTLQTLFLLAAGLSGAVSQEDNVLKVLPQFRNMILCVLPKSSPILDYADYGCYCGKGGSGTPVDDLDRCCMVHDHCYDDAMHLDECRSIIDSPYIKIYHYRCYMKNKITCRKNKDACARFICECDKKAAECFARTELNPKNKRLPKDQCQ
ncbi:putative phospholipase A2 minor isoenzyme-like [Scophthalmus maximus]|uniref:Phospholipase A2 n=1 Tax=Scophthalmus maximus TaxID=52904 RepID=A0A2U9CEJ0_SCOMX|nr:phospholipase A2-like [Scophthalmus maximus]AWP15004.1 putative phospholipase A2 minor isoenzyme-like [Scophthalmus maximus]